MEGKKLKRRSSTLSDKRKQERDLREGRMETQVSKMMTAPDAPTTTLPPAATPRETTSLTAHTIPEGDETRENTTCDGGSTARRTARSRAGSVSSTTHGGLYNYGSSSRGAGGGRDSVDGEWGDHRKPDWPSTTEVLKSSDNPMLSSMVNKIVKMKRKQSKARLTHDSDIFTSVVLDMIRGKAPIREEPEGGQQDAQEKTKTLEQTSAKEVPTTAPSSTQEEEGTREDKETPTTEPKKGLKLAKAANKMKLFLKSYMNAPTDSLPDDVQAESPGPSLLRYLDDDYVYDPDDPHNYRREQEEEAARRREQAARRAAEEAEAARVADLKARVKARRLRLRQKAAMAKEEGEGEEEESDDEDAELDEYYFTESESSDDEVRHDVTGGKHHMGSAPTIMIFT